MCSNLNHSSCQIAPSNNIPFISSPCALDLYIAKVQQRIFANHAQTFAAPQLSETGNRFSYLQKEHPPSACTALSGFVIIAALEVIALGSSFSMD